MPPTQSIEEIAGIILNAFAGKPRPTPEQVEHVMRPLGFISWEARRGLEDILHAQDQFRLTYSIGPWIEANVVTQNQGDDLERRIDFLLRDTCTCVLDHLRKAIHHAPGPVDPRILALLNHPHFHKEKK